MLLSFFMISACTGVSPIPSPPVTISRTVHTPIQEAGQGPLVIKLTILEEGIYEVSLKDLQRAGWRGTLLGNWSLQDSQGQELPIWEEQEQRVLRFYARPRNSLYSEANVYWLSAGGQVLLFDSSPLDAPTAAPPHKPEPVLPPGTHLAAIHLEQNQLYMPQVETGDHWLWATLPAPASQQIEFSITDLVNAAASLSVRVWSNTQSPESPDHHLVVKLNGQLAADEKWDGRGWKDLLIPIEAGWLRDGKNKIELVAPGDTGAAADIVLVDSLLLSYPRRYRAVKDRLEFTSPGGSHTLEGFSSPAWLVDVSEPAYPELVDREAKTVDGLEGHRYLAVGPRGFLQPAQISRPVTLPDLRQAGSGATWLAVGPADLLSPLQPLLALRREQGVIAETVPLEAIYDQFGGGVPEPEGIRRFLRYAAQNWSPAPQFLLLVGDASYDPRGYVAPSQSNRLPAFFVFTPYGGETSSDAGYTQLNEEQWAPGQGFSTEEQLRLAVGRIPAQTPDQVETWVKKMTAYEGQGEQDPWRHSILALADGQDPAFRDDARRFLNLFPEKFAGDLLASEAGASSVQAELISRLQAGAGIAAYFGHGSLDMWGKDRLFSAEDVRSLKNGDRLPVVLNFTCLTGLFTHPKAQSLAEAMLWQPDGGAIALLAPTSLTLPDDQEFLARSLIEALFEEDSPAIGEALLYARQKMQASPAGAQDVALTFLLFGDPALKIWQDP